MKKTLKGYIIGFLTAAILISGVTYAANTTTLYGVMTNGVNIVVDGKKINPTDVNGNRVDPMIYNGTTYLPVRAVANALGKAVYWDGPNYTVYLGDMDGKLEYPTLLLKDATNIGASFGTKEGFTDNYGNRYESAIYDYYNAWYPESSIAEYLLNMRYSRFKGYICAKNGEKEVGNLVVKFIADGRVIYTSPVITKTTKPIPVDVNITGCNDFQIQIVYSGEGVWSSDFAVYLADFGFYQ